MAKTALQELIEWLPSEKETGNDKYDNDAVFVDYTSLKSKITSLLNKERQDIEEAYFEGGKDVSTRDYDDAKKYFDETFN